MGQNCVPIDVEFLCFGIFIISTHTAHLGIKRCSGSVPGIGMTQFDCHLAPGFAGAWTILT